MTATVYYYCCCVCVEPCRLDHSGKWKVELLRLVFGIVVSFEEATNIRTTYEVTRAYSAHRTSPLETARHQAPL
eukprot:scaffold10220_cov272-Chaetoceros_neogracile.AAC.52